MPDVPLIHDLKEQAKEKGTGRTTVTSRCGVEESRNSAARLPENWTAWRSLVTCRGCLDAS